MRFLPRLAGWDEDETAVLDEYEGSPREAFEAFGEEVSIVGALEARVNPWAVIFGLPIAIYLLGLTIAFATGWGREYLNDAVPPVFAITMFQFLEGARKFDQEFFEMLQDVEEAFDETEARFYGFCGSLAERLYEPWPTAPTPTSWLHPTRLLYVVLAGYVVLLAVTGIGSPPANRPVANIVFFWMMTFVGIGEAVVLLWTISVTFVFMAIYAQDLDIKLDPLRGPENLGLRPYGSFVVSITIRLFLVLAVGGFSLFTTPSAFVTTLFVGGLCVFGIWFVGTQYGLHRSISRAKDRHREKVRAMHSDYDIEAKSDPDIEQVRNARLATEYANQLDSLPSWPVTWRSVVRLVATIVITLVSVGSGLVEIITHLLSF
ncbi:hypothetical protein [Natronomonas sp.]|uniref:hypothetical protein n=1 Tax=Natronomonas sp. TaxID=2184060 RepID=UPI002FC33D20